MAKHPTDEISARLLEIGRLTIDWEAIDAERQGQVDAVNAQYSHRLRERLDTIHAREAELEAFCNEHRGEILPRRKKTLSTLFGEISWRLKPAKIARLKGVGAGQATKNLLDRGHQSLVRIKRAPDKPALKQALASGEIDDAELRACGFRASRGEESWDYDLDRDKIAEHLDD